ncbi:MAG: response regulator [Methyloprofundus sp.]|nr:response regulator [Methyloprofundus sp.]
MINNKIDEKALLTPKEVAAMLLVSPITIRKWARDEWLHSEATAGGHRRFSLAAVERFAKERGMKVHQLDEAVTRILIVDDDEQFSGFLLELLESMPEKLDIKVVNNGFEAGSLVHEFKPHIILLDLTLPGVDGFMICKRLKAERMTKNIRVIAMTGFFTEERYQQIIQAGAETCLSKPIAIPILLEAVGIDFNVEEMS